MGWLWFFGADDSVCVFVEGNSVQVLRVERPLACFSCGSINVQVLASKSLQKLSVGVDRGHSIDGKQLKPTLSWNPRTIHLHTIS